MRGKVVLAWRRLRSHQYATCELQMYNMITCKSRDCDWDYCTHTHTHTQRYSQYSLRTPPLFLPHSSLFFFYCSIFLASVSNNCRTSSKIHTILIFLFSPFLISFPFHLACCAFRYSPFMLLYSLVFS